MAEAGKKFDLGKAILAALVGGGAGLIAGSHGGAGKDLRNILSGLGLPYEKPFELPKTQTEPAQTKTLSGLKRLESPKPVPQTPQAAAEPLPPYPHVLSNPEVKSSGDSMQPPDVSPDMSPIDFSGRDPFAPPSFTQDTFQEVVGPDGQLTMTLSPQRQIVLNHDPLTGMMQTVSEGDLDWLAATPELFKQDQAPTVEEVTRVIDRLEQGTQPAPGPLPQASQSADIVDLPDQPRISQALTVNGTPFDLGSPLDQVQAQAPYSEAEGLTDKTAPVAKAAVKENQKFRVDQDGLNLLEEFEGREPKAYRDGADHLHIGIGHKFTDEELNTGTVMIGGQAVDWRGGLRDAQINQLAAQDIAAAAEAVRKYVTVPLDQNKFNALVSFVFNIGSGAFKSSGALKALNSGNEQEFLRRHDLWNKAGGSTLEGLQKRRAFESALFSRGNVERR